VLADFIRGSSYAGHLRRIRHTYMTRRDCLVDALRRHFGEVELSGLDGGMHIAWRLPAHFPDAETVQRLAQEKGVGIYALSGGAASDFGNGDCSERIIMLGYSSLAERQIREGITRVAAALEAARRPALRSSRQPVAARRA
jgi:GntR family transcriptional regulator/MocR family aminotransferase